MKTYVMYSALGFNFNADIIDQKGELISIGFKTTLPTSNEDPNVGGRIGGEKWFTNWNESLLAKIRDYKKLNT